MLTEARSHVPLKLYLRPSLSHTFQQRNALRLDSVMKVSIVSAVGNSTPSTNITYDSVEPDQDVPFPVYKRISFVKGGKVASMLKLLPAGTVLDNINYITE